MPQEILSAKIKSSLALLKQAGILENFYLAGGTGLALQLNHRSSFDKEIKNFFQKEIKKIKW